MTWPNRAVLVNTFEPFLDHYMISVWHFHVALQTNRKKNPICNLFYLVVPWTAITQQHRQVMSQLVGCCGLWNVKCTVVIFLQFLVHFYSQVLLIGSVNFNFRSQYVLFALTSCSTSDITYYTVILRHKLVFLVLVWLITNSHD